MPGFSFGGRLRGTLFVAEIILPILFVLRSAPLLAQTGQPSAAANQAKASQIISAAVQTLGGERWLHLRTVRSEGSTASFYQGAPTGQVQDVTVTTELPQKQRFDFGKKGEVVQIYSGGKVQEITYKGVKELPKAKAADYRRWRDHSLGCVLREWYGRPGTILLYDGPATVERHMAEKVTLIGPENQAVTVEISTETHLPLRLSFQWRDPRFSDKSVSTVEFDNYEHIDGFAVPFTVTRTVNGETVWQRFLNKIEYNPRLPKDTFDPKAIADRLK